MIFNNFLDNNDKDIEDEDYYMDEEIDYFG